MASKRAIGVLVQDALDRLTAVATRLSEKSGVSLPDLQRDYRDPEYHRAMLLQAFADYLAQLEAAWPSEQPEHESVEPQEAVEGRKRSRR